MTENVSPGMVEQAAHPYFDCEQCGHIGLASQLREHPWRSMPEDIGFCPECGSEVRELETEATIRAALISYDEDPDAFLRTLATQGDR